MLTPDVGKIDLATKYRLGQITVATDMTWGAAGRPRARVGGAFDGSTEYWSSAVRSGGAGSYVVRLDRRHRLTRIGLSLRNGRSSTGRVYASTDGVNWGAPIVVAANRSHLALEYFPFAAPVSAECVKVVVDGSTNCERELGAGCAFLNELELYSTVNSFENDPVNNRPRGFTDLNQTWVTRTGVSGSSRALRLLDGSRSAAATAAWTGVPGPTKTLEFRVKPESLPNAFLFVVRGRTSAGASVDAFYLAVRADGSIARLHGKNWYPLTAAGVVPIGGWSTVGVRATTTAATILVDGKPVASEVPPAAAGATSLAGYAFASDGTLSTGDSILVDDVLFTD